VADPSPSGCPLGALVDDRRARWIWAGPAPSHLFAWTLAGALSWLAARLLVLGRPPLSLFACPFHAATGWPCPGCGTTRAVLFLARGEVLAALGASPLGTLAAAMFWTGALYAAARCLGLRRGLHWPLPTTAQAGWLRAGVLALLLANWAFVAWTDKLGWVPR
jgi:hypothetical protein